MIIGLVLIILVGKAFYQLAFEYDRNKWGYAIAGVASYYIGIIVSAFVIGIIVELNSPGYITESNETMFSLIAIPFGVAACWGFYAYLKRSWQRNQTASKIETLDGDMIGNSNQTSDNQTL